MRECYAEQSQLSRVVAAAATAVLLTIGLTCRRGRHQPRARWNT
jgi:hypothetical protein